MENGQKMVSPRPATDSFCFRLMAKADLLAQLRIDSALTFLRELRALCGGKGEGRLGVLFRFPQFDRIPFRIMQPGEPAIGIASGIDGDVNSRGT